jgi:aspartyl-tRNA(Asn)/glutamyl-tRNA(Gln) amidotransferase subunit C
MPRSFFSMKVLYLFEAGGMGWRRALFPLFYRFLQDLPAFSCAARLSTAGVLGKKQIRYLSRLPAQPSGSSMSVDSDTIQDIAQLARLRVEADELPALTDAFNSTLALFEQLRAAPTEGVAPMAHPLDAAQPLRADVVTEGDQRAALQAVAPLVEEGLYLVPRVVE